jgi:DNA-binding winged helix-turn-helix (wHTH) protein/tetratricopeptide (TPR) repeat protein
MREHYRIADLTVDVEAVSVIRDGRDVPLPKLSFDLLVALARRAPDVVRGDELIELVWAGTAVSDETLTQRVALLRRALGEEAKSPRYLRAVRGRGYQLIPAVIRTEATATLPAPPRRRVGFAGVATAVAILGLAILLVFLKSRSNGAPSPPAAAVVTGTPSVPELLARAGSYLRQHQAANNEMAIELYQRALRIEPRNPRALAGLSLALGQRATKFNQRRETTAEALKLARQAIAVDARLALAHEALGLALDSQGAVLRALAEYQRAAALDPRDTASLASAANLLQVEGHLAEALEADVKVARSGGEAPPYLEVQMGTTLALLGFDQAATVWFERALALRPDNVFAAVAYARMRLSQARFREADAIAARAVERGVRRPELLEIRGTVALLAGNAARAKGLYQEALAIAPGFPRARVRLLLLDRRETAAADLERRRVELLADLDEGRKGGDEWPDGAIDRALLEAGFGQNAEALKALDAAIALGCRDADGLLLDPDLSRLRGDPGFGLRIEAIRRLVAAERQRVVGAPWLPPSLLTGGDGSAARM